MIQVRLSLIFPLIQTGFTWGYKQIPWKSYRNMSTLWDFWTKDWFKRYIVEQMQNRKIEHKPSIQIRLSLIFPLILVRFAWGLKQISPGKVTEICPLHETFRQRSCLKVIDKQMHFFLLWVYMAKRCSRKASYISYNCVLNAFPYEWNAAEMKL